MPHKIDDLVPTSIATCRICGAQLTVDVDEWEEGDDGLWQPSEAGVHVDCTTNPGVSSRKWKSWFYQHWSMPYVDWLPVEMEVYDYLSKKYRFTESEFA